MYKESNIMFLYCETPMHAGSGTSLGAIDLPIQREAYTNFPTIAGSGIKGAVREWFEIDRKENGTWKEGEEEKSTIVFGPKNNGSEHAGAVSFTDAKLLLFPVKSLRGLFAWITCPTVLARLERDIDLAGGKAEWKLSEFDTIDDNTCLGIQSNKNIVSENELKVVLEEYTFNFRPNDEINKLAEWFSLNVIPGGSEYNYWKEKVSSNLLVLSDNNFSDFVTNSTEVNARIKLGEGKSSDTKKGGNLFYEENLPAESIIYSNVFASIPHKKNGAGIDKPEHVISYVDEIKNHHIQIGGDETVGKGIVKPNFFNGGKDDTK